jgi:hypothetical protein
MQVVIGILLGPQVGLGQRRTAEQDTRFGADEHDRSGEALLPEGGGGVAPGDIAANDHDRVPAYSRGHEYILPGDKASAYGCSGEPVSRPVMDRDQ